MFKASWGDKQFCLRLDALGLAGGWISFIVLVCVVVIQFGVFTRQETVTGPFYQEPPPSRLAIATLSSSDPPFTDLRGDEVGHRSAADLEVVLGAKKLSRPQVMHDELRRGAPSAFSHWGRSVYFTLPEDLSNTSEAKITVTYRLRLTPLWFGTSALLGIAGLVASAQLTKSFASKRFHPLNLIKYSAAYGMSVASRILIAIAGVYFATIGIGILLHEPLPTTTIMKLLPGLSRQISSGIVYIPYLLWGCAALGAIFSWMSHYRLLGQLRWRRVELDLLRIWQWALVPCLFALFLFSLSSGGWSGVASPVHMNYMSIGGLVPYSDAASYAMAPADFASTGSWNEVASRRPLAGAIRNAVYVMGGFSYSLSMIVQSAFLAGILAIAATALSRSAGLWSALAFIGCIFAIERPFLDTAMTEPLGMMMGLGAIAFLLQGFRSSSVKHCLVAFAFLALALSVRAGAQLLIPGMAMWVIIACSGTLRARILGIALGLLGVFGLSLAVTPYLSPDGSMSSVGYTLCGLARGTNWKECYQAFLPYIQAHVQEPDLVNKYLMERAREAAIANPSLVLSHLMQNVWNAAFGFPAFLINGFVKINEVQRSDALVWCAALVPGIYWRLKRRAKHQERLFWPMAIGAILASSALVMSDDGFRALHVSHAFIALLLSYGFCSPGTVLPTSSDNQVSVGAGISAFALIAIACVISPFIGERILNAETLRKAASEHPSAHSIFPNSSKLTGFIVSDADDAPVFGAPVMSLIEFKKTIEYGSLEGDFGPLTASLPTGPFAFLAGPDLNAPYVLRVYIAPVEMLTRRDVTGWVATTKPFEVPNFQQPYVYQIENTQPLAMR